MTRLALQIPELVPCHFGARRHLPYHVIPIVGDDNTESIGDSTLSRSTSRLRVELSL
jgi:hypothetical protein